MPAEEILNEGADADLIVLGSRGGGGFSRLLQGSVSSHVAEHAQGPGHDSALALGPLKALAGTAAAAATRFCGLRHAYGTSRIMPPTRMRDIPPA